VPRSLFAARCAESEDDGQRPTSAVSVSAALPRLLTASESSSPPQIDVSIKTFPSELSIVWWLSGLNSYKVEISSFNHSNYWDNIGWKLMARRFIKVGYYSKTSIQLRLLWKAEVANFISKATLL
jgi:hypothetical protein